MFSTSTIGDPGADREIFFFHCIEDTAAADALSSSTGHREIAASRSKRIVIVGRQHGRIYGGTRDGGRPIHSGDGNYLRSHWLGIPASLPEDRQAAVVEALSRGYRMRAWRLLPAAPRKASLAKLSRTPPNGTF